MRTLAIILVLVTSQGYAQDGRSFHELPPVENIVGAGMDLEGGSKDLRAAVWIYGIGTLATAILATNKDTRHTAAPWIAGGATLGLNMTFSLKGLKWMDRSGDLLQCGYSPKTLYESIPDSLGDDPPKRFRMPQMIDGTPIRPPGRFKHRREP